MILIDELFKRILLIFSVRNVVDPEISKLIDIGFPSMKPTRAEEIKMKSEHFAAAKNDKSLEKLSRSQQCKLKFYAF